MGRLVLLTKPAPRSDAPPPSPPPPPIPKMDIFAVWLRKLSCFSAAAILRARGFLWGARVVDEECLVIFKTTKTFVLLKRLLVSSGRTAEKCESGIVESATQKNANVAVGNHQTRRALHDASAEHTKDALFKQTLLTSR
jgi:hypothetical protein